MTVTDTGIIAPMLTRKELATILRVTTQTLINWEAKGRGPRPIRIEGEVRYMAEEVAAFVRGLQQRQTA